MATTATDCSDGYNKVGRTTRCRHERVSDVEAGFMESILSR